MSMLLLEGFEHYPQNYMVNLAASEYSPRWSGFYANSPYVTRSTGRTGVAYATCPDTAPRGLRRTFLAADEHDTYIMGGGITRGIEFFFQSDSAATTHIIVRFDTDGYVRVYRGNTSTLIATSATAIVPSGGWNYGEAKVVLSDTVGVVLVKVNGTTAINLTAADTKNAGTKTVFDTVTFSIFGNGSSMDDLFVFNGAGSSSNDLPGDSRIYTLVPNGVGTTTQLTPSSAVANWTTVDELPANGGDYVGHATDGNYDTYTFGDLPAPAAGTYTINGVQVTTYAAKSDTGNKGFKVVTRSGGTEARSAIQYVNTSFLPYVLPLSVNPVTGAAWTQAEINALEMGVEVGS